MNPEIKAKWLTALRNKTYVQGAGNLRIKGPDTEKFCCLGVLTDLAVKDGVGEWFAEDFDECRILDFPNGAPIGHSETQGAEDYENEFLPLAVAKWAGLDSNVYLKHKGYTAEVTQLNDGLLEGLDPLSFEEIADLIEQQL